MTNQPTPNENNFDHEKIKEAISMGHLKEPNKQQLRINEICMSILDHIQKNDIEFNNLYRDFQQTVISNCQFLKDDERMSLLIKAFFKSMEQYCISKKKNDIPMNEIHNSIEAFQLMMFGMFQKLKNDIITMH